METLLFFGVSAQKHMETHYIFIINLKLHVLRAPKIENTNPKMDVNFTMSLYQPLYCKGEGAKSTTFYLKKVISFTMYSTIFLFFQKVRIAYSGFLFCFMIFCKYFFGFIFTKLRKKVPFFKLKILISTPL